MAKQSRKTKSQEQNANVLKITEFCRARGFDAQLVGKWVWVSFDEAPDEETRKALKEAGFIYSPRRQKWAHNCGHPAPSAYQSSPWQKYAARWISGRYFREATA